MSRVPRVAGTGPMSFSSSTEVATLDSFATLDVNGYYRALGLGGWLGPVSARTIRRHFRRPDQWESPWMTYVVALLLDKDFRQAYNRATAPVVDEYMVLATRRRMADIAAQQRRRGRNAQQIDDLFRSFLAPEVNVAEEILDIDLGLHKDHGEEIETPFDYSYWLWGDTPAPADSLRQWQRLLTEALHRSGLKIQVTLGWGTFLPWDVEYASANDTYIIICGVNGPSSTLAQEAATLIQHHKNLT